MAKTSGGDGRRDAQTGDGTYVSENAALKSVTPPERALIHVYRGVGMRHDDIATELDRSERTVQDVLATTRERVEDGDDPLEVYAEVVGYAVLVGPHGQQDGGEA